MLSSHSMVAIPPEGPFLVQLHREFGSTSQFDEPTVEAFVRRFQEIEKCREWGLDSVHLRRAILCSRPQRYADVVDAVYREYICEKQPHKVLWGDKNPGYISQIPLISQLLPQARFIHIVRDGRDVAVSLRKPPFDIVSVAEAAAFWRRQVAAGVRSGRLLNDDRYMELRYEDLVQGPREVLGQVCAFCRITFEERMLEFYEQNRQKEMVPSHRLAWHQNTLQPVTQERMAIWKSEMSESDVFEFQFSSGDLLRRFDYELIPAPFGKRVEFIGKRTALSVSRASRFVRRKIWR
jgi:hypothetical protein